MAKPKMYGLDRIKQRQDPDQLERYWQRKRQRERTTPKPVAGQIAKEKEAKE